jgi:PPP family 3-phenylpropionic acid transporter
MHEQKNSMKVLVIQSALLVGGLPVALGFLPVYLKHIGFVPSQIGILMALNPLLCIVFQPFLGVLADRAKSKNRILIILTACGAVSAILVPVSTNFAYVMIAATMFTVFMSFQVPISESITLEVLECNGKSYGPIRMAGTIFFAVNAVIIGLLVNLDLRSIFYVTGAIGILNVLSTQRLPKVKGHQSESGKVPFSEVFKDKFLVLFLFFSVVAHLGISLYAVFLPMYFESIGGNGSQLGILFFLAAISEIPFLLKADKIIKRLSMQGTLVISMCVIALRFLLIYFIKTPLGVYPVALLNGLTYIVFTYSLAVYVNKTVKRELLTTGQTFLGVSMALGRILGALLGGYMIEALGISNTMLFTFLLCALSILSFVIINSIFRKKDGRAAAELRL